jgi:hypothetical protein
VSKATKQTVAKDAVQKVGAALANAYTSVEMSASHLDTVCRIAREAFGGAAISDDDQKRIVERMAQERGDAWTEETATVRKSEARKILQSYTALPEAIATVREDGACDWRGGIKLARLIVKHEGYAKAAVEAFKAEGGGKKVTPEQRAAGALKAWFAKSKGEKRANIIKAADLLGLKIKGVNVESK